MLEWSDVSQLWCFRGSGNNHKTSRNHKCPQTPVHAFRVAKTLTPCTSQKITDHRSIPRNYTQLKNTHIQNPKELEADYSQASRLLLVGFFMLALLGVRLGQSLLPDLAGSVLVKVGKKQIKHFRVPADGVTFDTSLDIL